MNGQTIFLILIVAGISLAARLPLLRRLRAPLLLGASYLFYAQWAGVPYLMLLAASSIANYLFGQRLRRRPITAELAVAVGFNVALLALFKYLLPVLRGWSDPSSASLFDSIILPLGISFWTFQAISYLVDIYLEKDINPSFDEFALYMAFWPTVISGPICRLPAMLTQFRQVSGRATDDISVGVSRLVQGVFMKIVLAELLSSGLSTGSGVSAGFARSAATLTALDVWALAAGFALQLYFDFAGYSHIAIGAARVMGIRVAENFAHPYLSQTPSVFWTRWHMSLSFWIRDYVFVPLSTLRRSSRWHYTALVLSMTVFGLWHGPRLTYLIWGAFHGFVLVAHRLLQGLNRRPGPRWGALSALTSWLATMLLVLIGYLWFRADGLQAAWTMTRQLVSWSSYRFDRMALPRDYYALLALAAGVYAASAAVSLLVERWQRWAAQPAALLWLKHQLVCNRRWLLAPPLALLLLISTLMFFGRSTSIAPFIYTLF
jgi:alginate O-acetyltransferase complex protein AlgI